MFWWCSVYIKSNGGLFIKENIDYPEMNNRIQEILFLASLFVCGKNEFTLVITFESL